MNFIEGEVENGGFHAGADTVWPLPEGVGERFAGRKMVLGVRPEHLELAQDGLKLTVQVIEPTGSETQIIGKIGTSPIVCLLRERISAVPGATIGVSVVPANVHLFDAESSVRIAAAAEPARV